MNLCIFSFDPLLPAAFFQILISLSPLALLPLPINEQALLT